MPDDEDHRIEQLLYNRDLDEEQQNADQQFIKMVGYLISTDIVQIAANKSFKNQMETILHKNPNEELYYRNEELEICLRKCGELSDLLL